MQYSLIDLLREDTIAVQLSAPDATGVIQALTGKLVASGHVTSEFADDVTAREKVFPTGLPTQPIAVAIPHADPVHVEQSAVAIGALASPVAFGQMGTDGSQQVNAQIVFLLAIKEKEKQVEMISQLMQLIQTPDLLARLIGAATPKKALAAIKANL